jgi:hypothetical protein
LVHGRCQPVDSVCQLVLLVSKLMLFLGEWMWQAESWSAFGYSFGYEEDEFVLVACKLVLELCELGQYLGVVERWCVWDPW